jgi:hypothetical protein
MNFDQTPFKKAIRLKTAFRDFCDDKGEMKARERVLVTAQEVYDSLKRVLGADANHEEIKYWREVIAAIKNL